MDIQQFWQVMQDADANAGYAHGMDEMCESLGERLSSLEVDELLLWNGIFDEYFRCSRKRELWMAASVIHGRVCSVDEFDCFRGWLITQGEDVFFDAVKDPDSLADLEVRLEEAGHDGVLTVPSAAYFNKLGLWDGDEEECFCRLDEDMSSHPVPADIRAEVFLEIGSGDSDLSVPNADEIEEKLPLLCKACDWAAQKARLDALEAQAQEDIEAWIELDRTTRLKLLDEWHRLDMHHMIIRAVESIPSSDRDYTLLCLYARALNNSDREAEGLDALLSVQQEGANDCLWHYRTAYSLYHLNRTEEALPRIEQAIALGDNADDTYLLRDMIRSALNHRDPHCPRCGRTLGYDGACVFCDQEEASQKLAEMSDDELEETIEYVIYDELGSNESCAAFLNLLSFRNINTSAIALTAFKDQLFYLPQVYKDAPESVRDGLIALLDEDNPDFDASSALACLAEIGDDVVVQALKRFDKTPHSWQSEFFPDPTWFLEHADLALDKDGNVVPLYFEQCYEFVENGPSRPAAWLGAYPKVNFASAKSPVMKLQDLGDLPLDQEKCEICDCDLMDLLFIDCDSEQMAFLGMKGKGVISLPVCPNCLRSSDMTVIRPLSASKPEIVNPRKDRELSRETLDKLLSKPLSLSPTPWPPFRNFTPYAIASIGGRGNWRQLPMHMPCPDCGKHMKLFAQLSWSKLVDDFMDGTLIVEFCPDCKTFIVFHQGS
ncbi:MAG: DUF4240 domain-containing protein [Clostridiales bacterium]|nr:DUF4240 domain-containing protein [Clostridiales bacterium]